MRLVTNSDSDDVLSGRREPPHPGLLAVGFVQQAIEAALVPVEGACIQCRSRHLRNRSTVTTRGQLLCWQRCSDCGHLQNAEIDV